MIDNKIEKENPIIWSDFPDLDVIRVEDTYYMVSTTMHFMPGAVILRSYDLLNWEILSYVCEEIEDTAKQRLENGQNIYGKGMWAATIRYHKNKFYVCFVANDTGKTYLYQSTNILGPWKKSYIEGFYHDCSLLFDEDDRVYIVYGNREIHLTELNEDLSGPKVNGLNRIIIVDKGNVRLGYEGAHIYKINNKYYVFLIHWLNYGSERRVEACYYSDSLEGEFIGKDILDDDMDYFNSGIAQGGIVDTPFGEWYAMLFQDHGAIGRIPVLVPLHWENDFLVLGINGKVPKLLTVTSTRPLHQYEPLVGDDDFSYEEDSNGKIELKKFWQWNHIPNSKLWGIQREPSSLVIETGKLSVNVCQAVNTLTQRMTGPICEGEITIEGSELKDGDFAGICALQGCYAFIALTKDDGKYYISMQGKELDPSHGIWGEPGGDSSTAIEYARIAITSTQIRLKLRANFINNTDVVEFLYYENNEWKQLGVKHKLRFMLDHFTGCRIGLFNFSTKNIGGKAFFRDFRYHILKAEI